MLPRLARPARCGTSAARSSRVASRPVVPPVSISRSQSRSISSGPCLVPAMTRVFVAPRQALRTPARSYATSYPPHTVAAMPSLSPTMTTGNIVAWKKKEGDKLKGGDVLAEIETDKAAVAFEFQDEGYLAKILYPKGSSDIPVGTPICIIVDSAADVAKFKDYVAPAGGKPAAPAAAPKPAAAPVPTPSAPAPAGPTPAAPQAAARSEGDRIVASPYAKQLAKEASVDLRSVAGTGPGGRIVAADVEAAKATPARAAAPTAAPAVATASVVGDFVDIPNSNIRRIIASRLSQSKQTIPHYYLTIDARVDKLQKLRAELNGKSEKDAAFKLSINDFIIKAAALACKKVPEANSSWSEQAIRRYNNVHVNVAVATDQGLLTPIVRDADRSGLAVISNYVRALADKAKAGKLTPADLEIGTFTISNLGMFGVKHFAAVILPPQSCILAVGTTEKRLVVNESAAPKADEPLALTSASYITFTLSCDHRVVDGAVGAQWLGVFKDYIEDPVKMLL